MQIWNAIKSIKSKSKLSALQAELEVMHAEMAGPKDCGVSMAKTYAADNYKFGGVAYLKDLCRSHANGIVHHSSKRQYFIPPSPETLSWGGFMGGENLTWNDKDDEDAAITKVVAIIEKVAAA